LINEGLTYNQLLFRGLTFNADLNYNVIKPHGERNLQLLLQTGNVKSRENRIKTKFNKYELNFEYSRSINSDKKHQWSIGPEVSITSYVFQNLDILDNIDLLLMYGLYGNVKYSVKINQSRDLQLSLAFPLVAWMKHENLNGFSNQEVIDGVENIPKFLVTGNTLTVPCYFRFQTLYLKKLRPKTSFIALYDFTWLRTRTTTTLHLYSNTLSCGFRFYM
jgi:hypothetical protein